jgi:predicted RNA methylase
MMSNEASTQVAFTPYEISFCLHDVVRTRMWKEAIEDTVKPGDVVVDAGSGTGILGVFAALAGAKKVYCIELHPRFVDLIEHLAARNGVSDVIEVIHADATTVDIAEPVDVLICELLCTGQFFEPQVQVVNHLRQFMKPDGSVIPKRVRSFVRLMDAQEMLYGVRIDTDSRSVVLDADEPVSTKVRYDTIEFSSVSPLRVDAEVTVKARKTRQADAVLIEGEADLTDTITTVPTRFLYNPEVIFLPTPVDIEQGRSYRVSVSYPYGCDSLKATFDVEADR